MNYELLKNEFGLHGSFLYFDDSKNKNGIPANMEDLIKSNKNHYIYLAMNIRLAQSELDGLDKTYLTGDYIFKAFDLVEWFMFHTLDNGDFYVASASKLNKLVTGTVLEGAYITDFFKVSPGSDKADGLATTGESELFDLLAGMDEKTYTSFMKNQLQALDREIELLGIKTPKLLIMDPIYDIFVDSFHKFINERDFPFLSKAEIVDIPKPYACNIQKDIFRMIIFILSKIEKDAYPKNIIRDLSNSKAVKKLLSIDDKLISIDDKLISLSILSLAIDDNNQNIAGLELINKNYKKLIDDLKNELSLACILLIIRYFFNVFYQSCKDCDDLLQAIFKEIAYKDLILALNDKLLLNLIQNIDLDKYRYIPLEENLIPPINLWNKILKTNKLMDEKSLSSSDSLMIEIGYNFDKACLVLEKPYKNTYLLFEKNAKEDFKELDSLLTSKYQLERLNLYDNSYILAKYSKAKTEDPLVSYFNASYEKLASKNIPKSLIKDDLAFDLTYLLDEKSTINISDLTLDVFKGYSTRFINDNLNESGTDEVSYISNSNINMGIIEENLHTYKLLDKIALKLAHKGDIIMSKFYPYEAAFIKKEGSYLCGENLFVIKIDKSKIDPYFVYIYLQTSDFPRQVKSILGGETSLSLATFRKIRVDIFQYQKMLDLKRELLNIEKNLDYSLKKISALSEKKRNFLDL